MSTVAESAIPMTGKFIVLEGIDGAGTTTQAERLGARLGARVHLTREPSDGPVGVEIRKLLRGAHAPFDHRALALLFAADRLDHLRREIEPALARGVHVVSDRYLISSFVYQTQFVNAEFVYDINRLARPADLTLLLRVPATIAAERRRARGGPDELFDDLAVQTAIASAYDFQCERLAAAQAVRVIDGARPPDAVFADVAGAMESCIGAHAGSSSP
jgi:dTMP kinase